MGSNKRKIIYYFVILISLILIPITKVKAETLSFELTNNDFTITPGNTYKTLSFNNYFVGYGQGLLTFSFAATSGGNQAFEAITEVAAVLTDGTYHTCDVGNSYVTDDSAYDTQVVTVNCSLDFSNYGLKQIIFYRATSITYTEVYMSDRISFTNEFDYKVIAAIQANNYNSLLNDINYNIIAFKDRTNEQLVDLYNALTNNSSVISSAIQEQAKQTTEKLSSIDSSIQETNESINKVDDTLNNSDSSEATDSAGSFFSGFTSDTFGLTSIITAPINLIKSITSSTCSSIGIPVPFVDTTMNLPCLSSIYRSYFGSFLDIYQTITFGIVAYWVCVRIFALVKDFKNPEHDEIEVLDL